MTTESKYCIMSMSIGSFLSIMDVWSLTLYTKREVNALFNADFHKYLKRKSSLMIFDRHANLKYKFGNRRFWAEGNYVSTVGLNGATIKKYIQEQGSHDIAMNKLSVKEYEDPFKGCDESRALRLERSESQRL